MNLTPEIFKIGDDDMITEKLIVLIITGIVGIGLTFARRYNNSQDKYAGLFIAGFTLGIAILTMLTCL